MKKNLNKNSFIISLIVLLLSHGFVFGQSVAWTKLYDAETDHLGACFSTNAVIDSNGDIINPFIETDTLKFHKYSINGSLLATLNTTKRASTITNIVELSTNQYALVFQENQSGSIEVIQFNNNLAILKDTSYAGLNFELSRTAVYLDNTLFFGGEDSPTYFLKGVDNGGNIIHNHSTAITVGHEGIIQFSLTNKLLLSFDKGVNNKIQELNPTNGVLNWEFVDSNLHLDYRVTSNHQNQTYYIGRKVNWIAGVRHDSLLLKSINNNGVVINDVIIFDTTDSFIQIGDIKFNPFNNHLYFSIQAGGSTCIVFETDTNFNILHQRVFSLTYNSVLIKESPLTKLHIQNNGNVLLAGKHMTNGTENGNIVLYNLSPDLLIFNQLDFNISPKNADELFSNVIFYNDSTIVLSGYTHHQSPAVISEEIQHFLSVISLGEDVLSLNKMPTSDFRLQLYPNPTSGKIKIEGELVQNVEVFNLKGQKVASYYNNQLDVSELPQGIYVVKIVGFNEYHTIRELIKH